MDKLDKDFRTQIDDGQPRGVGTGGLAAPVKDPSRGPGTGGLSLPSKEGRGEGTGGLFKPLVDPQRGEGSGGLAAKDSAPLAPAQAAPVAEQIGSYREPPQIVRSLAVAPGKKSALRGQLEAALMGVVGFGLAFFDAIVSESGEVAPTVAPESPETVRPGVRGEQPWESAGFRVRFDESGSVIVESVIGDSPAGRAGLQPLDVIAAIEDNGRPNGALEFLRGWTKGDKFTDHSLVVERNGGRGAISIPKR